MKHRVLGLAAAIAICASSASASIIYDFVGSSASGPNTNYTYNARLQADEQVNSSTSPVFAIVFDFPGVISATATNLVAGLTSVTNTIESTSTQAIFQNVPDNPAVRNVRSTITGTVVPSGSPVNLYTLTILSSVSGPVGRNLVQSAQDQKYTPGDPTSGTPAGNSQFIEGPTAVPEPLTSGMLGLGLTSLGLLARRRKK